MTIRTAAVPTTRVYPNHLALRRGEPRPEDGSSPTAGAGDVSGGYTVGSDTLGDATGPR